MIAAARRGANFIKNTSAFITPRALPIKQPNVRHDAKTRATKAFTTFTRAMASEAKIEQNGGDGALPKDIAGEKTLPKLSDHDFKIYNHMADTMEYFHANFRREWNLMWQVATTGKRPHGMTLRQVLQTGLDFAGHLTVHHRIEEQRIFPKLAKRMPAFDPKSGPLVEQHAQIHEGLHSFEIYLKRCQSGDLDFQASGLREHMEPWGTVLWAHLDDEVKTLGAENMRLFWSKEEMRSMPM